MTPTTITHAEADIILESLAVAGIDAARDRGQFLTTGHAALAEQAAERLHKHMALRRRLAECWCDRAPDVEYALIREMEADRMWTAEERAREAGG